MERRLLLLHVPVPISSDFTLCVLSEPKPQGRSKRGVAELGTQGVFKTQNSP